MIRILHLLDESTGWEQRTGLTQLIDRLPSDRYVHRLASLHPHVKSALLPLSLPISRIPRFHPFDTLSSPPLARIVDVEDIDLIHAWSVSAANVASPLSSAPLVYQMYDPSLASRSVNKLRSLADPKRFAISCSSEVVQRRLIEGGLPAEYTVVIRPGVDFSLINKIKRSSLRSDLGLTDEMKAVLLADPITREGGHFDTVYAVSIQNHVKGGLRIILPGQSNEVNRVARFGDTLPVDAPLILPGHKVPYEHLLSVADYLMLTPQGDTSSTALAWAMASGASIIATAVHSVAELVAHKLNGLLFKQTPGRMMAPAIIKCLTDVTAQLKAKEVARGHAYEVFGLRRYAEQTMQLYDNVLTRRTPADSITDAAIAG